MILRLTASALFCLALMPLAAQADYVDSFGDAQDTFGAGGPLLDIDTLSIQFDSSTLYFDLLFHTPISAASAGAPNSVIGAIEFDTDQSDETGVAPLQNGFAPPFANLSGVGVDFLLALDDFGAADSGTLFDADLNFVDFVALDFGPNSISGEIPLASLGGDDGLLNFTTTIGTLPQPTDATDSVATSTAIPEPTSGMVLGAMALLGLYRRRV